MTQIQAHLPDYHKFTLDIQMVLNNFAPHFKRVKWLTFFI